MVVYGALMNACNGAAAAVLGGHHQKWGRMSGGIPMTEAAREGVAIRVLIVDDHDLFRAGMASLLGSQPGIEVVGQASAGRMGVRLVDELQPDLVLMDLHMWDLEGADAT